MLWNLESAESVPLKNIPENKNILSDWGVGGFQGETSALAAHMNSFRGDPSTMHCQQLLLTTGCTCREPSADHVILRAGYPLVAADCAPNDLSHIPQDWPYEALTVQGPGLPALDYTVRWKILTADVVAAGQRCPADKLLRVTLNA